MVVLSIAPSMPWPSSSFAASPAARASAAGAPADSAAVPPSRSRPAREPAPVIDARTIKTILYLGLKGDIALGGGRASAPATGGGPSATGVEAYA